MRTDRIDVVAQNLGHANNLAQQALGVWFTGTDDFRNINRNLESLVRHLAQIADALGYELTEKPPFVKMSKADFMAKIDGLNTEGQDVVGR